MTATHILAQASAAYQGFSEGNMDPLFSQLHPQVNWNHHSHGNSSFTGKYEGPQGVMEYFSHMPEIEMEKFEVISMVEKDQRIIVLIDMMRLQKSSGKREGGQLVHVLRYEHDQLRQMDVYEPLM